MINLSKINIGSNDNNSFELKLYTNNKIKSIQIDPFGSNKMRFHYPPNFNFVISLNDNLSNQYLYTININKNKKNIDITNSQFFCSNGWTNNLSVTCLLEHFELDELCLSNFIPKNYGTVEVSNLDINDKTKRFKVGIVIPTFGREEYLDNV